MSKFTDTIKSKFLFGGGSYPMAPDLAEAIQDGIDEHDHSGVGNGDGARLNGAAVADVAANNVIGGIPVLFRITIPDAATGDVDVVSTHKILVTDCWAVKTGGAGGAANTVQLKNGSNAITNALDINVNDQTVVRAGTIDDARHEVAAGGTLKVTRTKAGGNAACIVYVSGLRIA